MLLGDLLPVLTAFDASSRTVSFNSLFDCISCNKG